MPRIQFKGGDTLDADQVDLSIRGWVIAELAENVERENRRAIPKENVEQIIADAGGDLILPSRTEGD